MPDSPPAIRPRPPAPADDWALFLDVDGCLLDFAPTPDAVSVPEALLRTLDGLHRRLDGALALVSGRAVDRLDALFAPLALPVAGLHGLQHRMPGDMLAPLPPPPAKVLEAARAAVAGHPGACIEAKGPSIALHWREAPGAGESLIAHARSLLEALPGYRLQQGDHVAELRPGGADKGDAISAFLREAPFADRRPVFAGDDLTDEHGFEVVNARGGLSILVGDRAPSAARFGLDGPPAVRAWLGSGMAA